MRRKHSVPMLVSLALACTSSAVLAASPGTLSSASYELRAPTLASSGRIDQASTAGSPAIGTLRSIGGQSSAVGYSLAAGSRTEGGYYPAIRYRPGADSDDDGLLDIHETDTGIYASATDTGTDPDEADTDGDGYCDGNENGGGVCTPGDSCVLVSNGSQLNSDIVATGDACQCGDVSGADGITTLDYDCVREHLMSTAASCSFDPDRCDVNGDGLCSVADLAPIQRIASGVSATIVDPCPAYDGL